MVDGGVDGVIGEPFKLAASGAAVAGEAAMGGRGDEESGALGGRLGGAFGLGFLIKGWHFILCVFGLAWVNWIHNRKNLSICNLKTQKCRK